MSNSTYDKAKWVALTLLPALSALYVALAASLGWGHVDAVVGVIAAVDTFLGTLLGISAKNYTPSADGVLHVDHGKQEVYAALEKPAKELTEKKTVTLAVNEVA